MKLPVAPFAVITGAGSGFGRALGLLLASRGATLLLSDRDLPSAEESARMCRQAGAKAVRTMICDVTRTEDIEALAAACEGRIDLVVNNAGVSSGGLIGEMPIDLWRWTLDVDLWGVIYGCHVFAPILRKQGSGNILNMASAAGLLAAPRMGAYNVAKAGVVALSETLSGELRGSGVDVTVLCPTFFKTNIATSGRFSDAKIQRQAERLVDSGKTADEVATIALAAVERGDLYCVPMADGRWFWRLKRAVPESFVGLAARAVKFQSKRS